MKKKFYNSLYKNEDFCHALGKVMLSAGKLESLLRKYLRLYGENIPEDRATLGNLIRHLRENELLTNNGEIHFGQINIQRNYLVHNLYASFLDEIEIELLPVENLVPEDIELYIERAFETARNFELYSEMVSKAILKKKQQDETVEDNSETLL